MAKENKINTTEEKAACLDALVAEFGLEINKTDDGSYIWISTKNGGAIRSNENTKKFCKVLDNYK